ncbi:hypothetical protein MKK88_01240, partial [Methylobacterium sp. E-005]|uniref:hypothetical protein n=1 Tax=Methylobacterium sp. E-005 TaxID=2836549 RepID=UPI001FB9F90E
MASDQENLLAMEDWRYYAIDNFGTGLGMIATEERLSKNVIGFGLPSAPALYLNMAFSAHRQRIATNIENL